MAGHIDRLLFSNHIKQCLLRYLTSLHRSINRCIHKLLAFHKIPSYLALECGFLFPLYSNFFTCATYTHQRKTVDNRLEMQYYGQCDPISQLEKKVTMSSWKFLNCASSHLMDVSYLCAGQIVLPPSPPRGQQRGQRENECDKGGALKKEWLECLYRAGKGKNKVIRRPGQPPKKVMSPMVPVGDGDWIIWPTHKWSKGNK